MKIVRPGVFETNSSSSHSMSIDSNDNVFYLESLSNLINSKGEVWIDCEGDEMDSELTCNSEYRFIGAERKISFLATIWNSYAEFVEENYNLDDLKDMVKKNTGCDRVVIYNMGCVDLAFKYFDSLSLVDTKDELYNLIFDNTKEIVVNYRSCI
jgi:hypothetical protein